MTRKELEDIFCENLKRFQKSVNWLNKSHKKCKGIELKNLELLKEEEFESLDALANRFGRSVDILINKILRGLDLIELEDISRKLDIVIRAEKRGFVNNYEEIIEMKDLRNELTHEYIEKSLIERFREVIEKTPSLLLIYSKIIEYIKRYNYCR